MMRLTDLKYCFSGSLTITEFLLLSLVILEDSGMLERYFGDILNQNLKKIKQKQLMNYNALTSNDIYLSPLKHLELISLQ